MARAKADPTPNRGVTMKTIADRMGVSVTTVARALSNSPKTSQKMIEEVGRIAEEMGYVRNLDGVKLRTGRSFALAAVLNFPIDNELSDATAVGLLRGLHERCAGTEYAVRAAFCSSYDEAIEELRKIIGGRSADAVVLDLTSPMDPRVKYLLSSDFPFVTFGRTEFYTPHAYFDVDNVHAAWQGTNALIQQGRKRIAMLDGPGEFNFVQQRVEGYRKALRENDIPYDDELVHLLPLHGSNARALSRQLVRDHDVDGFVYMSDNLFLRSRAGIRDVFPDRIDDFGYAVRCASNFFNYVNTPVFASYYSHVTAGWHLADILIKQLADTPVSELQRVERTELRTSDHF